LTQPKETKRQVEAPATVSHAFAPPSGKKDLVSGAEGGESVDSIFDVDDGEVDIVDEDAMKMR
jgi:hypothetical protein